jgi:hypothetical protein
MIESAKARGIAVILLTPTPDLNAKLDDPDDPLNQHAEQLRRLAREHDVVLVDSLRAFREKLRNGVTLPDLGRRCCSAAIWCPIAIDPASGITPK